MHVDFAPPNQWEDYNEKLTHLLALESGFAQIYRGTAHATQEICLGLAKLFPHKRKVFYFKGLDQCIDIPMTRLALDGYEMNALKLEDFQDLSWVESLDRETLMVVFPEDVPFLGLKLANDKFTAALKEQKLFRVGVSHASHRYEPPVKCLDKQDIKVRALSLTRAVGLLGERARISPLTAQLFLWDWQELPDLWGSETSAHLAAIATFESVDLEGGTFFLKDKERFYDRSLIAFTDMDGHAIIDQLAKASGTEIGAPGEVSLFETTSLSRWGGVRTMDWLKNYGLSAEQIRGLVIVDGSCLTEGFTEQMSAAIQTVRRLQKGC